MIHELSILIVRSVKKHTVVWVAKLQATGVTPVSFVLVNEVERRAL